ncbi:MAG: GAF domain-containing protein [bacterium]
MEEKLLTVEEVAKFLDISETAVYKLIASGELRYVKLARFYRFKKEWIDEFLERESQRKEGFAVRRSKVQYYNTLYQVTKTITSTLELDEVLRLITEQTVKSINVKACSIRLLDEDKKTLRIMAAYGLSEDYLKKGPVEIEKSLIDKEVLEGKVVTIKDATKDAKFQYPEEAEKEGIRSVLCVPLQVKDRIIGVMRVYTSNIHNFTQTEIEFLTALASSAAIAIENAKLYNLLRKNYDRLYNDFMQWYDSWSIAVGTKNK